MKKKFCIVVMMGSVVGFCSAEMFPTIIDPNNPAKLANPPSQSATPSTKSTSSVTPSTAKTVPALTPDTRVEVKHIQFIGGTRYSLESLIGPFRQYVGKTVPLSQLLAATDSLTQRYHNDGYVLSYAYLPTENFQNGMLKVGLVEGYVTSTQIHSDNKMITAWLSKLSKKIMAEKPQTRATFDRYSMLMSRTPDTKVTASAKNPDNIYGAAVMDVDAKRTRNWNVMTSVDSRRDSVDGVINATLSGLTPYGEQLGVATLVPLSGSTKKKYGGLNYQQYLNDDGLLMQLKGSYFDQNDKDFNRLQTLPNNINVDYKARQTQYNGGFTLSYPLELNAKKQWTLSGGADYLYKKYNYDLRASNDVQSIALDGINQFVRYPALEASLNGYREYEQFYWNARFNVRQGVDGLGASSNIPATDLNFTRWRFNGDAAYLFAKKWRLSTSWEGDWSNNDLPEPERASFGSSRYARGYQDGEATGDYGYGGQVEMRYIHDRQQGVWLKTIQPYVVMDTARTYFNQSGLPKQRLASYALGVTLADNKHYSVSVEAARPIGDVPLDNDKRNWRLNATFTYNFNSNI
ncbi:ShlB/FhaC/HecB family hemolysin secretion/activation protein [Rouxiella sp. T17]|uniref:ShlB/FhaC/HecB family hemolysin secretion/activation protein n=1 Tax=Rouxiella sp. T17 TaxID=3085684 RepID=UPI003FA772AE